MVEEKGFKMITYDILKKIAPYGISSRVQSFVDPLNQAMRDWEINTRARVCAFLAQLAHESASFNYVEEIASGQAYEGRKDLGNIHPGDGVKFKGRGLIQITGRANYEACSKALGLDLLNKPELLEDPVYAAQSAGWFWKTRGLNELADMGGFKKITRVINGGYNGLASREEFHKKALEVIK